MCFHPQDQIRARATTNNALNREQYESTAIIRYNQLRLNWLEKTPQIKNSHVQPPLFADPMKTMLMRTILTPTTCILTSEEIHRHRQNSTTILKMVLVFTLGQNQ
jgi:hypothetical protein